MNNYKIYEYSEMNHVAIKEGFNWVAFFFTWLWALLNKLYLLSLVLFVIFVFLSIFFNKSQDLLLVQLLGRILIGYYIGSEGNNMKEKYLLKKGYKFVTVVSSDSPEFAIKKYLAENKS